MNERKCIKCFEIKDASAYYNTRNTCKICINNRNKEYRRKNPEKVKIWQKKYEQNNQSKIIVKNKKYYENNKEKVTTRNKKYIENNKDKILKQQREYDKKNRDKIKTNKRSYNREYSANRRKLDPGFKINKNVLISIKRNIKGNNVFKNGKTISYLPFNNWEELKQHLESLFESWMNWDNWGRYNVKTWDDNDSNTWTWQIDHIVPQSDLPYDSMEHSNFKKCWSLENLRPLSAKQNILDGVNKIRHKKDK